ncbi:hypothetical protein BWI17_21875 [Betaproteobacteria bacterium GR16-43]|nr:hypothetical protein BWI17_21875 [Betaproteobacteria bacterium GR16-43]
MPILLLLVAILLALPKDAAAADTGNRSGREVVEAVCSNCHRDGVKGAPKIGDREAWIPRMKRGLHDLTLSAIRGHGGMPARGGHAELTDTEVRNAIAYMFDPEAEARAAARPAPAPAPVRGPNEATVNGIEIHFGLISAERLRAYPRESPEARMHGGVPSGSGYYHVNVTLFDATSHAQIRDAAVEVDVVQAGADTQHKTLESLRSRNAASYGEYVRLVPGTPSNFTVRIRPAGSSGATEVRFARTPD